MPDGFSLHHGSYRHRSTMGLPGPHNVQRRTAVSASGESTGGADMGAHAQALLDARPAVATVLAGRGGLYQHDSLPGAHCLVGKGGTEPRPARIRVGLAEMPVPYQIGDPQVFQIGGVAGPELCQRGLVVEVLPPPSDFLVMPGHQPRSLVPAFAPLLPTREGFPGFALLLFHCAVVTGTRNRGARCRNE